MRLQIKWVKGWAQVHGTGPDGQRIRRSLKTQDARRAEEARAQLEARLWQNNVYGPESVVTFEECALAYAEDGGDVRFIVKMTEQLGKMRLKDITPKVIRDAARKAYPFAKPATLNRQGITPARAVINFGHEQGWCAPVKVKHFKADKPERKAVGREYLEALAPYLPPRLYALMLFLHQTGRRVGDALMLEPKHRKGNAIRIPKTKNGEPATVYLTDELAEMLDEVEPRHGKLFGYIDRSSLYPTLRRASEKAGVEYLGTHQPGRHSFATALDEAGWSTKAIADAGGWKSVRIVAETYSHPTDAALKASGVFGKKMAKSKATKRKDVAGKGVEGNE